MQYPPDYHGKQKLEKLDLVSPHKTRLQEKLSSALSGVTDAGRALAPVKEKMDLWRKQKRSRSAKDYADRRAKQAIVDQRQKVADDLKAQILDEDVRIYHEALERHDLAAWEHKVVTEQAVAAEAYKHAEASCQVMYSMYGRRREAYEEEAKSVNLLQLEGHLIAANARLEGFRAAMLCRRDEASWRPLPGWKLSSEPTPQVRVYMRDLSDQDLP